MQSKKTFIFTPSDMLKKMELELEDFKKDSKSSRFAINFVLTAHHLKEWVWKSYLSKNKALIQKISPTISDRESYYNFLNIECGEIKLIRELANNIKHFYSQGDQIQETSNEDKTWENITCPWDKWEVPSNYDGFILITKDNRWVSALNIFQTVYDYWATSFDKFFNITQ